jgi:hypothetical protein
MQGCHDSCSEHTNSGTVAIKECADVAPDKYTTYTNLPLILYHHNNKVCVVDDTEFAM